MKQRIHDDFKIWAYKNFYNGNILQPGIASYFSCTVNTLINLN